MMLLEIKWTDFFKILADWRIKKWVHEWIVKVLLFLESKAIPETPIRTWNLRKWYYTKSKNLWWKVANKTEYAPFVHDWTKFIKANPFLKRVEDKNEWQAWRIMNREIAKVLQSL